MIQEPGKSRVSGVVGRSVIITSNLLFRDWDRIFDPMTTAAAIDRLVHHAVIIEMSRPEHPRDRSKETRDPDDNYDRDSNDNYEGAFRQADRWGSVIVVDGEK